MNKIAVDGWIGTDLFSVMQLRQVPDPKSPPDTEAQPATQAPFRLRRPTVRKTGIAFASPHSGRIYPDVMRAQLRVPLIDLQRTEDAFVDELFDEVVAAGAPLIDARFARSYVDLNRDARELDPDMFAEGPPRISLPGSARVRAGLGCLPRVTVRGDQIYHGKLSRDEGTHRLSHVHDAYHTALSDLLDEIRAVHGFAVLIDCHSMPSVQPGRRSVPDIVLGDRFGSSCDSRLTAAAERLFRDLGYTVERNVPYAGGYTTRRYGRPRRGIHALQIEIRRGLYMNEDSVEKSSRFDAMRADTVSVAGELIGFVAGLDYPP